MRPELRSENRTLEECIGTLPAATDAQCGGSVCSDRFFGLLSGKIVQLVVVVAVGM
jgi:hypothetical protein